MKQLKIMTFNCEWMVSLFGGLWTDWVPPTIPDHFPGRTLGDLRLEPIDDVPGLCQRIAGVINEAQPQIIGIQEGPPRADQLQTFVARFLNNDYEVHHSNSRWQSICALVHKSVASKVTSSQPVNGAAAWSDLFYYPWGKLKLADRKTHKFDRHPLILSFKPRSTKELQIIILHTKSKYSKLKTPAQWEQRDSAAILDALAVRAKLATEIARLRQYLTQLLEGGGTQHIVVMGDLNDGPYAELIEREFLIHNIVDELAGSLCSPTTFFHHAMTPKVLANSFTAQFPDPLEGGRIVHELIDHMLLSPAIWQDKGRFHLVPDSCQVETRVFDLHNEDDDARPKRGLRPSDHRPVSAVFEY